MATLNCFFNKAWILSSALASGILVIPLTTGQEATRLDVPAASAQVFRADSSTCVQGTSVTGEDAVAAPLRWLENYTLVDIALLGGLVIRMFVEILAKAKFHRTVRTALATALFPSETPKGVHHIADLKTRYVKKGGSPLTLPSPPGRMFRFPGKPYR